jgi:hypothetical protein
MGRIKAKGKKNPKDITEAGAEKLRELFDMMMMNYIDNLYDIFSISTRSNRKKVAKHIELFVKLLSNGTVGELSDFQQSLILDALDFNRKKLSCSLKSKREGDRKNAKLALQMINIWINSGAV